MANWTYLGQVSGTFSVSGAVTSRTANTVTIRFTYSVSASSSTWVGKYARVTVGGVASSNDFGQSSEGWETYTGSFTKTYTVGYGSGTISASCEFLPYTVNPTTYGSSEIYAVSIEYAANPPAAPTNVTNTRNSDNSNTIAWTNNATTAKPYESIAIQRSTDGGSFATIVTGLAASSTSYQDNTTSADHTYAYKVVADNTGAPVASTASSTTTNTPAAPTSITLARASSSGTDVIATITNESNVATSLEWQSSTDKTTWSASTSVSGKITSLTLSGFGGTYYFRVRNVNSTGASAWLVSNAITTITAPNPPTLVSPAAGGVVSKSLSTITFAWTHNSIDGSAQTAAVLQYSTDSGTTWTTGPTITTAQSATVASSAFAVNSTVQWRVKTKGAATTGGSGNGYSNWSNVSSFKVCQIPTINVTSPAQGASITVMPLSVAFTYSDQSGTEQQATIAISDSVGTVFTKTITGTSCSISASEWVPTNGSAYTVAITAQSTSSLSATASVSITIAFVPPAEGTLTITNDSETGYATLLLGAETPGTGETACDHLNLFRVSDNGEVLLASGAATGTSLIDRYAPLNTDYYYKVVSVAQSGSIAVTEPTNYINTPYGMLLYGTSGILKGKYDPELSRDIERPDREYVGYWGRQWPVMYDSKMVNEEHRFSFSLLNTDSRAAIKDLMISNSGKAIYKSIDGDVFHCGVEISESVNPISRIRDEVTLDITRVDGDAL